MVEARIEEAMVMGMALLDPEGFKANFVKGWTELGPDGVEDSVCHRMADEGQMPLNALTSYMDHLTLGASYVRDHDPDRHAEWGTLINAFQGMKQRAILLANLAGDPDDE